MIFGSIGMGYLIYGKKQRHLVALMSGVALCVFPYFVADLLVIIPMGIGLMALSVLIQVIGFGPK